MNAPRTSLKTKPVLALAGLVAAAAILSACSGAGDLFADAKYDNTVLPGQRISVARADNKITADPDVQAVPVVVPSPVANYEWRQPGGVPSNAPQHLALSPRPRNVWRVSSGEGSSSQGRLTASPIIVGGRIYVIDTEATVHAHNAQNGKKLWSRALTPKDEEAEEGFGGGVASDGTRVYAATGFGTVVALDSGSGRVIWNRKLEVPIRAAPTVAEGQVFITTVNNEVFALSTFDGNVVWKFSGVAESAGVMVNTSPALDSGMVVMPYTSGDIIAFGARDGRAVWNDNLTRTGRLSSLESISNIGGRPVIHRGIVFAIAHGGRLVALDLKTGQRLWAREISGVQTPWAAGDFLFIAGEDNVIVAIAAQTGKVKWIRQLPKGVHWSGPVLAGGQLILVASDGTMLTLAPHSGDQLTTRKLDAELFIPPVVANATMYLYTNDAELIALR